MCIRDRCMLSPGILVLMDTGVYSEKILWFLQIGARPWKFYIYESLHNSSVVRAPAAQTGGPGFDTRWLPCTFLFQQLLFVYRIGWCLVQVAVINGALVQVAAIISALEQFGCYQWCSSTGGCYHQCSSTVGCYHSYKDSIVSGMLEACLNHHVQCMQYGTWWPPSKILPSKWLNLGNSQKICPSKVFYYMVTA